MLHETPTPPRGDVTWKQRLGWLAIPLAVAGVAYLWFTPSGTGEYRDSPDGRYIAHAMNLNRGTWLSGRINYIELRVCEKETNREIWRAEFFHQGGAPDYADRSKERFIRWAADSSSVTIPIDAQRTITIPTP